MRKRDENMRSPCLKEASQECHLSCCQIPFLNLSSSRNSIAKSRTSFAASRFDFAETTSSSIFPNIRFTNHESLPSLKESFIEFIKAYPQYSDTHQVDTIRSKEYYHLSQNNHICLDYIGIGLFSYSQLQEQDSYGKQLVCAASSSSLTALPPEPSSPTIPSLDIPFFSVSYKTVNLKTQLLHGGQESELESAMKKKIMGFLNISENDYSLVFTTNRTSAFKLVSNSYPFKTSRKLLTVYDYESEAVEAMIQSSEKRGAKVLSAEFSWPRLRIQSSKLRKMLKSNRKKKKKRGLFVFPLHSRITGARYPYLWMSVAQENGWHVLFDACALGSKDMDSFGLSLLQPDFLICSFYKVFGENPCGFGCLFVKKSAISILESSTSTGIVNILPANEPLELAGESSGTDTELEQTSKFGSEQTQLDSLRLEKRESSDIQNALVTARLENPEVPVTNADFRHNEYSQSYKNGKVKVECRALDQVDSLGLVMMTNRSRYLINWIVNSLMKLEHPNTEGTRLVRIYGPKIRFDRGPALAFNVYDWKGEKVEPVLVQKLAGRSNISLSYGFLHHIWFSDKYRDEKGRVLEKREIGAKRTTGNILKDNSDVGITVVTSAFGFLSNFEDAYSFWAFVAQFLDADFVEKERWRYTALNQKTIEI